MTLENWIAYSVTVFIFLVSPGPSHLFMLSKSLSHGFGKSWATGAGDLTAHLWQIGIASIGLVSFIYTFQNFFIIIKVFGPLFRLRFPLFNPLNSQHALRNPKNISSQRENCKRR